MSQADDYESHDALGLAEMVASGQTSASELLDAAIERAERHNPQINALSQKLYDHGRDAIAAGLPQGAFRGVPFLLKDVSVLLAGTVTTQGSRLFTDFLADHDSTIVARYKQAGAVIFGKTTTPEMGLSASTETTLTGDTRNPWNLARTPGGSSGGAAAAVAARIVPMAHASDGGGSIRIPASACGLFGLKPTRGRNPAGPDVGEGWGSLATSHVISRTVRDSAAMLDATHGQAPGDPYWAPPAQRSFLAEVGADPGRRRIAVQRTPLSGVPVDPQCLTAVDEAARLLEDLGHHVEEAMPPGDWNELGAALWVLLATNVSHNVKRRAAALGRKLKADDVDRITWSCVEFSATVPIEAYPAAMATIHQLGRDMAAFHERFDLVLSPTLAQPPVPFGPQHTNNPDPEAYREALLGFTPFTSVFNMTGQPSMSVPLHWTPGELPVGIMVSAPFGDEATLLRLAGQLEQARPWRDRRPKMRQASAAPESTA
jgi:amidase